MILLQSKILLEVVEHTHTQPPAAGRHMGLGGPSLAGRDSGLTPDSSTIETGKWKNPCMMQGLPEKQRNP
jgi:hypothetical protein